MLSKLVSSSTAVVLTLALAPADDPKPVPIFDGKTATGWIINSTGNALPAKNVQPDGLNPHASGAYIITYEKPARDFTLDFDYKLSKGCNSGVFIRVADPKDPVTTGVEIALDDTTGTGMHDSGAFYDLVPPTTNAQKPAGQWNHMTITARGPIVTVEINGQHVATLDHDRFPEPGKRPDGSDHKFTGVTIKDLNHKGHFGFQDHGQDCWFKDVRLAILD